jgi:hypothetical protein
MINDVTLMPLRQTNPCWIVDGTPKTIAHLQLLQSLLNLVGVKGTLNVYSLWTYKK